MTFAWERIKADPGTILGTLILGFLLASAVSILGGLVAQIYQAALGTTHHHVGQFDPIVAAIQATAGLLNWPLAAFCQAGMAIFALKVARGEPYALTDVFSGGPSFLSVLVSSLLIGLAVSLGLVLLIVPGVILALGWLFTIPVIVDKRLGPVEAMKESWRITDGQKGTVLLLVLVLMGVSIAGWCACCVGLLVALPICQIAQTYAYLRLSGQRTAPVGPAA